MDDIKIAPLPTNRLVQFIKGTLQVDIPLYHNNSQRALKFDFEPLEDTDAFNLTRCILEMLFGGKSFWACEYGSNSEDALLDKQLLASRPLMVDVIPYESSTVDTDWFDYFHKTISCSYVNSSIFCFDSFISYAFRCDFLSNTIFLIDDAQGTAVHIYDRRGMDVASTDYAMLKSLYKKFYMFTSKHYRKNMDLIFSKAQ